MASDRSRYEGKRIGKHIHGDWKFNNKFYLYDENNKAYAGVIYAVSEWGFQLILDTAWEYKYGGSDGTLYYKGSNLTEDATLAPGTYTLTVDLINRTYTIK